MISEDQYTSEFRQYSSRIGRWLSLDPILKDNESPYTGFSNNPIWFIDPLGSDTLLVNKNSGSVLGTKKGGEDLIFTTNKKSDSDKAWKNSEQLYYNLNISGDFGGTKSQKNDPVIWSNLQDFTDEFNQILHNGIIYWEDKRLSFDDNIGNFINKITEKNTFFRSMVTDNAPFDIKQNLYHPRRVGEWSWYKGTLVRYDDYGNILYGAGGSAFGFGQSRLLAGANINQLTKFGLDDQKDRLSIKRGIDLYRQFLKSVITITPK